MGKRSRYQDHVDPEYRRWGRTYPSFPGVDECVRLIVEGKAVGAWADIVTFEFAENAAAHYAELVEAFEQNESNGVSLHIMMALEIAALPESVSFLSGRLHDDRLRPYAERALRTIDTKESRRVLFEFSTTGSR